MQPNPPVDLYEAAKDSDYQAITAVLKNDPLEVNKIITKSRNIFSLFHMILKDGDNAKNLECIKDSFLENTEFKLFYSNLTEAGKKQVTNFEGVFTHFREDVLEAIIASHAIENSKIINTKDQLTYIWWSNIILNSKIRWNDDQTNKAERMLNKIGDVTYVYGNSAKDKDLLKKLDDAGYEPSKELKEAIIQPANESKEVLEKIGDLKKRANELIDRYTFFTQKEAEIAKRHHDNMNKIYEKAADNRSRRLDDIEKAIKQSQKPPF